LKTRAGTDQKTPTRAPADREMPPRHNVPFILDLRARMGATHHYA
jgi:hypothetical protein